MMKPLQAHLQAHKSIFHCKPHLQAHLQAHKSILHCKPHLQARLNLQLKVSLQKARVNLSHQNISPTATTICKPDSLSLLVRLLVYYFDTYYLWSQPQKKNAPQN